MLSGSVTSVHGTLTVSARSSTRLRWTETGVWERGGVSTPIRRALRIEGDGDLWSVVFDDGRPFHDWAVDVDVVHTCSPDRYTVRLNQQGEDWTTTWRGVGPRKRLVIVTAYSRSDH